MNRILIVVLSLLFWNSNAQDYLQLEGEVPSNWESSDNTLSISTTHCKLGSQSVKWEWNPNSNISIKSPLGLANACNTYKGGMMLWIYNENAKNNELLFEFMNSADVVQYYFTYHIDFVGWRACWIRFDEDMLGVKQDKNLTSLRIVAPNTSSGGTLYFDRMKFPATRINDRVTPDAQLDYINPEMNANHWSALWHWYSNYQFELALPQAVTSEQKDAFGEIRQRITANIKGNPVSASRITEIRNEFADLNIQKQDGVISGAAFVSADEYVKANGDKRFNDLDALVYDIAKAWYHTQENGFDQYFIDILDWLYDQGLVVGSGLGTNHHYGYEFRGFPKSIWLMQDVLKSSGKFDQAFEMIQYWTGVQEVRQLPEVENFQGIVDAWNTIIPGRLLAIMLRDDSPELVRDMQSYVSWMDAVMKPSVGLMGGFKPDGAGFHHGMIYAGYMNGGFGGLSEILCYLGNTPFNLSIESRNNLRKALDVHMWYSNLRSIVNSVCGRKPMNQDLGTGAINAYAYLAKASDPVDRDAAAQYMRLTKYKKELYDEFVTLGITAAQAPQGNKSINYGALNIHRRDNWMAAIKGFNNIVTGTEIYTSNNRYGRYQSYGTIQILGTGSPVDAVSSGYSLNGWDWNRFPGATTIHLPYELLDYAGGNINERSDEETFAGACTMGDNGIFGMILDENNHVNYTDDFVARKSVFAFDNRIVCLGSGISNGNTQYPTETTLFQVALSNTSESVMMDNNALSSFPLEKDVVVSSPVTLMDTKGNGYYIPSGSLTVSKMNQESRNNINKTVNYGDFATAWLNHGKAPVNKGYEYAILVQSNHSALQNFSTLMQQDNAPYSVIRKDNVAHIVYDKETDTYGYVCFEPNVDISDLLISQTSYPCLIMTKQGEDNKVKLVMTDPSLNMPTPDALVSYEEVRERRVQVTIKGSYQLASPNSSCNIISNDNNTTILEFICIHGLGVEIDLIPDDTSNSGDKVNDKNEVTIFPNPANEILNIDTKSQVDSLRIIGVDGSIHNIQPNKQNQLSIKNLTSGVYYLEVILGEGKKETLKFIKK
ncbi:chondroitinase family polysaccharide lyase [Plebeiibacterium marinum]|uniref:Chondroitinase family polysaccharide lyase n=1 Tax=Plebeiibacterium marinum TaxID=2992111 RepID=A0AAE3SKA4_9BACT|nr:chondroitinase family polysaccharide lyase [Plebeiobacterium marinum]MCW3806392.1 chondroitinase family polysaccharide lyase [Plebeiobacterium marinum]